MTIEKNYLVIIGTIDGALFGMLSVNILFFLSVTRPNQHISIVKKGELCLQLVKWNVYSKYMATNKEFDWNYLVSFE